MGRRTRLASRGCMLVSLALLSACGASSSQPATPTVGPTETPAPLATVPSARAFTAGLVTDVGGLNDRGFNQMAWKGLRRASKQYGIKVFVKVSHTEADYETNMRALAQNYTTLIITVGYSMSHAVFAVAHQFPKQRFAVVDARPLDDMGHEVSLHNVENILFKEQESGYLAGVVTGLMERRKVGKATHNTVGYLGGRPIAAVDHYLAGFVAGAKKVNPTIKVIGEYAGSFVDPKTGRAIAQKQIGQGADVLFQAAGETGSAYLAVAKKRGRYGVGVDTDESFLGRFIITSAVKRPDVAVIRTVGVSLANRFTGGDHVFGSAAGAVGVAPASHDVPAGLVAQALAYGRRIAAGQIVPPTSIPAR